MSLNSATSSQLSSLQRAADNGYDNRRAGLPYASARDGRDDADVLGPRSPSRGGEPVAPSVHPNQISATLSSIAVSTTLTFAPAIIFTTTLSMAKGLLADAMVVHVPGVVVPSAYSQ